jgi:hypothetical protein
MTRPSDEQLLAFLTGTANAGDRDFVLTWIEADPGHAQEVREAAAGLEAIGSWRDLPAAEPGSEPAPASGTSVRAAAPAGRRVPAWWLPVAAAASVAIALPLARVAPTGPSAVAPGPAPTGQPVDPDPSFVVILHGVWPDADGLPQEVVDERAAEYWAWTSDLASRGVLVAAGDLRWEPGMRLETAGSATPFSTTAAPDFLVGMFAVRARDYEEARRIAAECPHLRYGGTVSVRRVGGGFVTVDGADDWSD